MTDAAWLKCTNPVRMLAYLGSIPAYRPGRPTSRKLRLFACAAVRMFWAHLTDGSCRTAVEVAEQFADGLVGADELNAAREAALRAWQRTCGPEQLVFKAAHKTAGWDGTSSAPTVATAPSPALPAWNDSLVPRMANAIYEERALPEGQLDPARLAILGDALEDAGCPADHELLQHLRAPGPHVRGCWVVDLLTGRE